MSNCMIIEKTTTVTTTSTREVVLTPLAPGEQQKERHLKVQDASNGRVGSQLMLSGRWLENAGFRSGDHVSVSVQENRLVVEKITDRL